MDEGKPTIAIIPDQNPPRPPHSLVAMGGGSSFCVPVVVLMVGVASYAAGRSRQLVLCRTHRLSTGTTHVATVCIRHRCRAGAGQECAVRLVPMSPPACPGNSRSGCSRYRGAGGSRKSSRVLPRDQSKLLWARPGMGGLPGRPLTFGGVFREDHCFCFTRSRRWRVRGLETEMPVVVLSSIPRWSGQRQ